MGNGGSRYADRRGDRSHKGVPPARQRPRYGRCIQAPDHPPLHGQDCGRPCRPVDRGRRGGGLRRARTAPASRPPSSCSAASWCRRRARCASTGCTRSRTGMAVAHRIGVLFGQRTQLWWDLPVAESLAVLRDIYGIDHGTYRHRLARFDEVLELGEILPVAGPQAVAGPADARRPRRGAAAQSRRWSTSTSRPSGSTWPSRTGSASSSAAIRDEGTTVMLTSHDLADIEGFCRRLVIIDKGRIIFDGDLEAVKDTFARERILHVETERPVPLETLRRRRCRARRSPSRTPRLRYAVRFDRFAMTAGQAITALADADRTRRLPGRRAEHRGRHPPGVLRRAGARAPTGTAE